MHVCRLYYIYIYIYIYTTQLFSVVKQPDICSCKCKFFCVYKPYKELIPKEMNTDNNLNLHSMAKLSGWLRYCLPFYIYCLKTRTVFEAFLQPCLPVNWIDDNVAGFVQIVSNQSPSEGAIQLRCFNSVVSGTCPIQLPTCQINS